MTMNKKKLKIESIKTPSPNALAELAQAIKTLEDAEKVYNEHKASVWKEVEYFYYKIRDFSFVWFKYYANAQIKYLEKQRDQWKGFLTLVEDKEDVIIKQKIRKNKLEAIKKNSIFSLPLDKIMELQKDTHPDLKIPFILQFLINTVYEMGGLQTEGILRLATNNAILNEIKSSLELGEFDVNFNNDPNLPACLIKNWLKSIATPIIPQDYYITLLELEDINDILIVIKKFPEINRQVLYHIVDFARKIAEHEPINRMSISNLVIVFAPNLFKNSIGDLLENTVKEGKLIMKIFKDIDMNAIIN